MLKSLLWLLDACSAAPGDIPGSAPSISIPALDNQTFSGNPLTQEDIGALARLFCGQAGHRLPLSFADAQQLRFLPGTISCWPPSPFRTVQSSRSGGK